MEAHCFPLALIASVAILTSLSVVSILGCTNLSNCFTYMCTSAFGSVCVWLFFTNYPYGTFKQDQLANHQTWFYFILIELLFQCYEDFMDIVWRVWSFFAYCTAISQYLHHVGGLYMYRTSHIMVLTITLTTLTKFKKWVIRNAYGWLYVHVVLKTVPRLNLFSILCVDMYYACIYTLVSLAQQLFFRQHQDLIHLPKALNAIVKCL